MSATLAGPPGDCCRQTVQHVGEPRGKVETVAGVETYVARPADGSNKRIILFFGDVYGPMYVNSQLIMDFWADNGERLEMGAYNGTHCGTTAGYLVVGLDYFEGDSMIKHPNREVFDYPAWVQKKKLRARELVPAWVEVIRKDYGLLPNLP